MNEAMQSAEDLAIVEQLNFDYNRSDQARDMQRFALRDFKIRILGNVALIHGRATYTMIADGVEQAALQTDVYQKHEGAGHCVSACAIAPGA